MEQLHMPNAMEDFRREITYNCSKEGEVVLLTATMKDVFHDIKAEVAVDAASLVIRSARVYFRRCPNSDCCKAAPRIERLVGFTIGKGMSRAVMDAVGGVEGCGNIRTLLLGLLPLALNVRAATGIVDEREMLNAIHNQLVGTCAGYATPVPADS